MGIILLMKRSMIIISAILFVVSIACEEGFPTQDKAKLPTDHTDNKETVMHKSGAEFPFSYDNNWQSSCAGSNCHKPDLRGGMVKLDGDVHTSPSCYQCHGKLWHQIDTNVTKIKG